MLDVKEKAAERMVLETLITQKLIDQELKRIGMDVTEEEFNDPSLTLREATNFPLINSENRKVVWTGINTRLGSGSIRQMKFNQVVLQPRITINEDALLDRYNRQAASLPQKTKLALFFFRSSTNSRRNPIRWLPLSPMWCVEDSV